MSYNREFKLNTKDLELIENALISEINATSDKNAKRQMHKLLGKLHQQKNWYRPRGDQPYISG